MSAELIAKLKHSREVRVPSGDLFFIITRPTEMDIVTDSRTKQTELDYLCKYVVGWDGVTERQIAPGAGVDAAEFDKELFRLWISDHSEHWTPIIQGIKQAVKTHQTKTEEQVKN